MAKKYCEKCFAPTEMVNLECRKCGSSSFVHALPEGKFCDCGIPDINGSKCEKCGEEISPARLAILSTAKTWPAEAASKSATTPNKKQASSSTSEIGVSPTGKTIDDLIRAQNRTTHAVRAFVRFLFIQLSAMTLGVFIWNLSTEFADPQSCAYGGANCTGNDALQVIAALVILGGIAWSSFAGWSELEKSNI